MIRLFSKKNALGAPYFEGTRDDFHRFLSGFCRNLVQKITRPYKTKVGCCQNCGTNDKQLDAAHTHGNERKVIINNILAKYERKGKIRINLDVFELLFIEAHQPIEESILILCKNCHSEYDQKITKQDNVSTRSEPLPKSNSHHTMTKSEAIQYINNKLGKTKLSLSNTNYSNINKGSGRFWLNIEPSRFQSDLNIILVDKTDLIWINLPSNSVKDPANTFYTRKDNGKVDLDIPTKEDHEFLRDKSGYDFRPFTTIYER